MLIDVSDVSTIPIEVKNKIYESFSALPEDVIDKLKNCDSSDENIMLSIIEKFYRYPKNMQLYSQLTDILEKYEIVCFHSTKMISKGRVKEYGLSTNEWSKYKSNIIDVYKSLGIAKDKIEMALKYLWNIYKDRYLDAGCEPHLCFFSNLSMLETEDGGAGYNIYCENIGGEMAKVALQDSCKELYSLLKNSGKSFVVKFKIPYSRILDYRKDDVVFSFISYYAGLYFQKKKYEIGFLGETQYDISSEDILDIIDYAYIRSLSNKMYL